MFRSPAGKQYFNKFQADKKGITTTKQAITSFAGLSLLLGMAENLGLEEQINALPLKERARGYKPAESAFALMGLIQSGGEALDDVSLLKYYRTGFSGR